MGMGGLDLSRKSVEDNESEILRSCFFSAERWLPRDEVEVVDD